MLPADLWVLQPAAVLQSLCLLQIKDMEKIEGSEMALFAAGSAWHPLLGAEWNCSPTPPTSSTPPTFSWPTTFNWETDSGLDVTRSLSEPPAEFQSCLYACLIGQKQHAWLCSWGNGKTLERAEQPGISPRAPTLSVTPSSHFVSFFCPPSCFLVMCGSGHVCCHSSANYPPAWLDRHCEISGRCFSTLAPLYCYRVAIKLRPTFKIAEYFRQPSDLQFRHCAGRQHNLFMSRPLLARIRFTPTVRTGASHWKLIRPFSWSTQCCLPLRGLRGNCVS